MPPALDGRHPLPSWSLHLSPCLVLSRWFWPRKPLGSKRESHCPAGQLAGSLTPWTRGRSSTLRLLFSH